MLKRYHLNVPYHFKLNIYKSCPYYQSHQPFHHSNLQPHPKYTYFPWHSYSLQGNSLQKFLKQETSLGLHSPMLLTLDCSPCPPMLGLEASLCHCVSPISSPISFLDSCHCSFHFTIGSLHCYQNYLLEKKKEKSIQSCQFALKPLLMPFCLQNKFQSPCYAPQGP